MTLTSAVVDCRRTPQWSARAYRPEDLEYVLTWFTEADFFYRTAQPDTRPEWEILDLLGDDTMLLLADDEPVGLYAIETVGSPHFCHYQLVLRLRGDAPRSWWQSAFHEIVRSLRWDRELVRLAVLVGEFDRRGIEAMRSLGLTDEGTLGDVVVRDGNRYGWTFYSALWPPR